MVTAVCIDKDRTRGSRIRDIMSIHLPGGTVPTRINLPSDNETDTVMREIKERSRVGHGKESIPHG